MNATDRDELKRRAAERAVEFVAPGMVVGLGHGSTAIHAVRRIAARIHAGELPGVVGVPCSLAVEAEARRLAIPLASLDERPYIDITIDGADEVDPALNVIKGGGGALLREKMVAQATRSELIVVDEAKLSPALGTHFALPVEIVRFSSEASARFLRGLGATVTLRRSAENEPFLTDQGNLIFDCAFGPIPDPVALAAALERRAGIVEHGLFLGLVSGVIVAGENGIRELWRP